MRRREDFRREADLREKLDRDFNRGGYNSWRGGDDRPDRREGFSGDYGREDMRYGYSDSFDRDRPRGEYGYGEREQNSFDSRREDFQRRPQQNQIPPKGLKCFRCGDEGHYQASCTKNLICYNCKKEGHVTLGCPDLLKCKELQIFGFGIPGQGFYALEVEELTKSDNSKGVGAIIKVVQGEHSIAIIEKEMRYWVDDKWAWNLNKVSNDEYLTSFPNASAVRICMRGGETYSPLCKLLLKVKESDLAPGASAMLQTTWVKVFDVPPHARNEADLKEISKTFGRPRSIDVKTLPGLGPIRVQVDCREAAKLRGRIEIFLHKAGFKFKIEAEGVVWDFSDKPKPSNDGPGDDYDANGGGNSDESPNEDWDRHRKQNKDKNENSGSKHVGSTSDKQHLIGHYVSCFTPSSLKMGAPSAFDGSVEGKSDKEGSVSMLEASGDKKTSLTHTSSKASDSSESASSQSDSSGSPLIKSGGAEDSPNAIEERPLSWNSAGTKSFVLKTATQDEIMEGANFNCTPEEDVFDSEFGKAELEGMGVRDNDNPKSEEKWTVYERNNGKRSKTVPVLAARKSSRVVETGISM
ncbi:hypothetical protein ACQ4PT_044006 [Festuca glaucescens]